MKIQDVYFKQDTIMIILTETEGHGTFDWKDHTDAMLNDVTVKYYTIKRLFFSFLFSNHRHNLNQVEQLRRFFTKNPLKAKSRELFP